VRIENFPRRLEKTGIGADNFRNIEDFGEKIFYAFDVRMFAIEKLNP